MNIVEKMAPSLNKLSKYAHKLEDEKLDELVYQVQADLLMLDLEN